MEKVRPQLGRGGGEEERRDGGEEGKAGRSRKDDDSVVDAVVDGSAGGREGQRGIPEGPSPAHFFASQDSSGSVLSGRNVRGRLMPTSSSFAKIMFTASGTGVLSVLMCTSALSGAS